MSMQQLMNLAQYCLSHEHHVIMAVFCMNLHAPIARIIVPVNPYDASTNATKTELRLYGIRKDIIPLDEHNNTSSTPMGEYDTVYRTRSSGTVVEEQLTSPEGEQPYEGIALGPRTRCVLTDDVFTGGLSIPTVDGKLKLTSTTSNATTSNGHQNFGSLMGSRGLQYHIDRTNHGTNRRGVTNECRPHVDTDSISTIDASTFREYWYSKSSQISRWCSHGI